MIDGMSENWLNLTTLDIDASCSPDVVYDLEKVPYPFQSDSFDEIHAYEVLEHIGMQGDYRTFFAQFYELWRILKPNGILLATVPDLHSRWAWGDPGHRRVITVDSLVFLRQESYREQIGVTCLSDYRWIWKGDFDIAGLLPQEPNQEHFGFALRAIKG